MRSRLFLLWLIQKVVHYRKLPVVSYTYPNRSMRYAWGCMSMICNITADIRTYACTYGPYRQNHLFPHQ